jgi:class 3 adenylate cyclase
MILTGGADDPLKTHRRGVIVVFLDLRGFTTFAETSEPEEAMGVLREYHAAMGTLILEHEGTTCLPIIRSTLGSAAAASVARRGGLQPVVRAYHSANISWRR